MFKFSESNINLKISLYKYTASDWLIGELDELSEEHYVIETLFIYIKDVSEWVIDFFYEHAFYLGKMKSIFSFDYVFWVPLFIFNLKLDDFFYFFIKYRGILYFSFVRK